MKNTNSGIDIKELYESDIDYYSTPPKSQEVWWFIIKDASKQISNQLSEEAVDKEDYKYIYIRLFNEFHNLSNEIISDNEFNQETDFNKLIKTLCEEALYHRRNFESKNKTVFLDALKEIPTYHQDNFYQITQLIWILPETINELFIEKIDQSGVIPSLSRILDDYYPQQVLREIKFISSQSKKARDNIITSYLPWVKWRLYRYQDQDEYDDLIQAANIGLIRAVDKFDITELNSFKTYAVWWIKQSTNRYFENKSRTIRLPSYKYRSVKNIKQQYHNFIDENFYEPTVEDLADLLDETEEDIREDLKYMKKPLSLEEIKECEINLIERKNDHQGKKFPFCECCRARFTSDMFNNDKILLERDIPICLDPSIAGIDRLYSVSSSILNKVFFSDMHEKMETFAHQQIFKDKLDNVLRTLKPRYVTILKLRYGIDNREDYTLREVGDKFDLSRERIRQIEAAAIRELHNPRIIYKLEGHVD